ncbi:MAG: GMP synthase (glutamine-hydrolyzing) [Sulfurimonas sp.]|jgi:GMP synthase (glutamine-hydrolysing)
MKYIYILKIGETFESTKNKFGDFNLWVRKFLGKSNKTIKTIHILNNQKLPNLQSAAGFIITGSHAMVSEELQWSVELEKYIQKIASKNIPLLGICYGHQLIAKALGGRSAFNKKGVEIGRVKIKLSKSSLNDPLLKDLPKLFYAYETHYQSAVKLPLTAIILASNTKDNHQAVRFTKYIWGVQFHPEFDANIMKEYIMNQKEALTKNGFSVDTLLKNVKSCNMSHKILSNFLCIVQSKKVSTNKMQ